MRIILKHSRLCFLDKCGVCVLIVINIGATVLPVVPPQQVKKKHNALRV